MVFGVGNLGPDGFFGASGCGKSKTRRLDVTLF